MRSMNGLVVDGRKIEVSTWDGKTKYAMYVILSLIFIARNRAASSSFPKLGQSIHSSF